MIVKFIGTGSMISNDNSASYLIDNKIMIDFPNGTTKVLKRKDLNLDLEYIFLTHTHGDHYFDLPFIFLDCFQRRKKLNVVFDLKDKRKVLKLLKLAFPGMSYKIRMSKLISFLNNKKSYKIDNILINRFKVSHGHMYPCYGYKVQTGNNVVVFSGDSSLCEGLLNNVENADYLICDCTNTTGNDSHIGVDNIKMLLDKFPNLKIIPSHMGKNSKIKLKNINNNNLLIKEDMEELIIEWN